MTASPARVGLFGLLGSGNIGNDASLEAVLGYLRTAHSDVVLDAMCSGPERLRDCYGIAAVPLSWYQARQGRASGAAAVVPKAFGKVADLVRTASWVRRHDVVIVPGMGVLETTLPVRALGFPLTVFAACAAGRIFGTRVALVSVGANAIRQPVTRWLLRSAARLAFYCSFRDAGSRAAMAPRRGGPDGDTYPDLVFSLPVPESPPGDRRLVGIGVMDFSGANDERQRTAEVRQSYVAAIRRLISWLLADGRQVRLFVGDTNGCDDAVLSEVLAELEAEQPGLLPGQVSTVRADSFAGLMQALTPAGMVVATRYHNVICALRLCKPTISLSYAAKHDAVMADMGLARFCQPAWAIDLDRLIEQLTELEGRSGELRAMLADGNAANARRLDDQFAALSALLFPAAPAAAEPGSIAVPAGGQRAADILPGESR